MLEPKEIDNYFTVAAPKKTSGLPVSRHTRWVMLAKLALPGLAAILAVILLVFPSIKKDAKEFGLNFVITQGDIEKLNIEKTTIYVTDNNNRVNNFIADRVKETAAGSQIFTLTVPEAIMPLNHDEWISIKSPGGLYNQQTSLLHLQQNVEVFYSRGMNIQTEEAFFDFKKSIGYSHKPVIGDGFIGKVNAEGFEFSNHDNTLTFLGKTRILINEESLQKE